MTKNNLNLLAQRLTQIDNTPLTPPQKHILKTLVQYHNQHDYTTITIQTLAKKTSYHPTTIKRTLKQLQQKGHIIRIPRNNTSTKTHYIDIPWGLIAQEILEQNNQPLPPHIDPI